MKEELKDYEDVTSQEISNYTNKSVNNYKKSVTDGKVRYFLDS